VPKLTHHLISLESPKHHCFRIWVQSWMQRPFGESGQRWMKVITS